MWESFFLTLALRCFLLPAAHSTGPTAHSVAAMH